MSVDKYYNDFISGLNMAVECSYDTMMIKMLIKNGADVNLNVEDDWYYNYAILYAILNDTIFDLLINENVNIHYAVDILNITLLDKLINLGINTNEIDRCGSNCLFHCLCAFLINSILNMN